MQIDGPQIGLLEQRILSATSEGKLQDWIERIGEFAISAGMSSKELSDIPWSGSPMSAVHALVSKASYAWNIDKLTAELDRREQAQ